MLATIGTVAGEILAAEALRIFDGFTAWQWAAVEEHVAPSVLAHAQAQPTRAEMAVVIVAACSRMGLLALDREEVDHV